MTRVLWDGRWHGQYGIARFSSEVHERLRIRNTALRSNAVAPASLWDPLYLAWELRTRRPEIFISPGFNAALPTGVPQLLTIHDLIHLRDPAERTGMKALYYERIVLPAIRKTGAVLTVSEFTRHELMDWSGLEPESVICVGNGTTRFAADTAEGAEAVPGRPYVLYVGNAKPHKNVRLLVAAMRYLDGDIVCVTVGVPRQVLHELCTSAKVDTSRFVPLTSVSDGQLGALYSGATCLAIPSTYEGFGLPALEAMAAGTASAYYCDAVAEVVGSAGARCADHRDAEQYAVTINRAMEQTRDSRAALLARADTYSWTSVAAKVDSAIKRIARLPL